MKISKSALIMISAGFLLIARLVTIPKFEITLLPVSATPDNHVFSADQSVIPAGGCITLSWDIPHAQRVVLDGSNWPEGLQEAVTAAGKTVVCPSAATHYKPGEPVRYTLKVAYVDGHDETYETVVNYDQASAAQIIPSATFDPYATPAGIPATPDVQVNAVFQMFENGWMLWRGDTNTIFVLTGDGTVKSYHVDEIPSATARFMPFPPPGRLQPAMPFDALWRYYPGVPVQIGWATMPAETYTARVFGQVSFGFGMTLPDGRYVGFNINGPWYMTGITSGSWTVSGGAAVIFLPPSYPTLTPPPTATLAQLGAIYQTFEHGFMLWRQDQNCVYTYIYPENNPQGTILIPYEIRLINDISSSYHYCVETEPLGDNPLTSPAPSTLSVPVGELGKVWGHYDDVRKSLGYATAQAVSYVASFPPIPPTSYTSGTPWDQPLITLPDGKTLWCGFRSATAGMCRLG